MREALGVKKNSSGDNDMVEKSVSSLANTDPITDMPDFMEQGDSIDFQRIAANLFDLFQSPNVYQ